MFILCGTIGALIISVIEIVLFCRKRSFGKILHETVKNIFIINLVSIGLLRYVFKYDHFLDTTNYSTGKIAEMVGYNDRNYFASVFSKKNGMTPMQYRASKTE